MIEMEVTLATDGQTYDSGANDYVYNMENKPMREEDKKAYVAALHGLSHAEDFIRHGEEPSEEAWLKAIKAAEDILKIAGAR